VIVSDNYFLEEEPSPNEASIKAACGASYPWYEGILEAASGYELDWKHYGKKYGWKLKAHDGAKALFELGLGSAGIRISIAARESELEALRGDPAAEAVLAELLPPGKSKEGWGIRLLIDDEVDYGRALLLVKAVARIRKDE
jgi:hypothetical protein